MILKKSGVFFLALLTVFYSFGGLDLYLGLTTPFAPKKVDAAYTGTSLRTVEYVLGGGSDANGTARTSGTFLYAGSSWNTVRTTAGTSTVTIEGTNIRARNAFLEVRFQIATGIDLTDVDVTFASSVGDAPGVDVRVGLPIQSAGIFNDNSGPLNTFTTRADVTGVLNRVSDAQWNSGIGVVAGFSALGPSYSLASIRLVVTYEEDYDTAAHDATKTVRFPLDSTVGGETGSKLAACAAAATCAYEYRAELPDLASLSDIHSIWFELHGTNDSATNPSLTPRIQGGANGPTFSQNDTVAGVQDFMLYFSPATGTPNFVANATSTFEVVNGAVAQNVLGGELVITYKYSTGAARQTETVRYFMLQQTAGTGLTKTAFSQPISIGNAVFDVRNIWFKARAPQSAANTLTLFGTVGAATERSNAYTLTGTGARAGESVVYYDLTLDRAAFTAATTTIAGAVQWSSATGDAGVAVELYATFTWKGDTGGPQTKTAVFFAGADQGTSAIANEYHNTYATIFTPETVSKVYRSGFAETVFAHSDATAIILSTITMTVNGASTLSITEEDDTEAFTATYLQTLSADDFTGGNGIVIANRITPLNLSRAMNQAEEAYFANVFVVTYEAGFELLVPSFTQSHFRFYVDNDALLPTDPWPAGAVNLGEDTVMTMADSPLRSGSSTRIRMSFTVATTTLTAGAQQFRLQYAPKVTTCSAIVTWFPIGAPGSGTIWRGVAATPVDGTALSGDPPTPGDTVLALSDRAGTYEESNDTAVNPFAVAVTEDVEYDWNIENNNAATSTTYCFRMVKNDDTPFWGYTYYPEVSTEGYAPRTDTWRWYDDETNEKPVSPLAATNTAPVSIADGNVMKLRVNVREVNGENGVNQQFKVQYSINADFSSGVFDAKATTTCAPTSGWCYGNGIDTDQDPILSRVLLGSTTASGTHNEGTTTPPTFDPVANTATEYEFTLKRSGGSSNTTYYFRLYDMNHSRPVPLYSGATYPSLSTDGTDLTVVISGIATSTVTEGVTASVATSPTSIPLGTIATNASSTAAQRIDVTTNATEGYQVLIKADSGLVSTYGNIVPDVTGTNAAPTAWATGCTASMTGCWGYHPGDDTLLGGSTRFTVNDTFAQFATTSSEEIAYNSGPVVNEITDMVYRTEIRQLQPAGSYTVQLQYIVVPIF